MNKTDEDMNHELTTGILSIDDFLLTTCVRLLPVAPSDRHAKRGCSLRSADKAAAAGTQKCTRGAELPASRLLALRRGAGRQRAAAKQLLVLLRQTFQLPGLELRRDLGALPLQSRALPAKPLDRLRGAARERGRARVSVLAARRQPLGLVAAHHQRSARCQHACAKLPCFGARPAKPHHLVSLSLIPKSQK